MKDTEVQQHSAGNHHIFYPLWNNVLFLDFEREKLKYASHQSAFCDESLLLHMRTFWLNQKWLNEILSSRQLKFSTVLISKPLNSSQDHWNLIKWYNEIRSWAGSGNWMSQHFCDRPCSLLRRTFTLCFFFSVFYNLSSASLNVDRHFIIYVSLYLIIYRNNSIHFCLQILSISVSYFFF